MESELNLKSPVELSLTASWRFPKVRIVLFLMLTLSYFLSLADHPLGVSFIQLSLGYLGFLLAEAGNVLAEDYYLFRRQGGKDGRLLSDWIKPEQLVLKGAWGAYLLAFLCVLLVALSMGLRGWVLFPIALTGFLAGYFAKAEPYYWDQRSWGPFVSGLAYTFVPYFSSSEILISDCKYSNLYIIFIFYVGWLLWRKYQPENAPVKYSKQPLPPYTYVPGVNLHPRRDQGGHSYGQSEAVSPKTQPEFWKETELYLYGVDLFNAGYFWEAHEAWESLWKPLHSESDHALFLQGLIQVTAASLKYKMNSQEGVIKLSQNAIEKLMKIQKSYTHPYMGVDLKKFLPDVMMTFSAIQYLKDGDSFPKFRPLRLVLK